MIHGPVIRVWFTALLVASVALSPARGADDSSSLLVRSALAQPDAKVWVGQRVILNIDVLSADGWANLPSVPRLNVPGTIVYPSGGSAIRLNETIDGRAFSGQRYEFWVYPQSSGSFTIPAIELTVSEKVFGASGGDRTSSNQTKPVSFACEEPPGWNPELPLVTSSSFEATQAWTPEVKEASVGDGVTRELTMTGADVPGMALPPLSTPPIAAIRSYPKQPSIDDKLDRGSLLGRRSQAETLVFQGEGQFDLPGLVIQWWNPKTENLQTISLPGRTIAVAPAPLTGPGPDGTPGAGTTSRLPRTFVLSFALILLGLFAWAWIRREGLKTRWQNHLADKAHSEQAYFRAVEQAAATDDPSATLNALLRWLDRVTPAQPDKPALLSDFVTQTDDEQFGRDIDALLAAVNGAGQESWRGAAVLASLRSHRRTLCPGQRQQRSTGTELPPLNPQTSA